MSKISLNNKDIYIMGILNITTDSFSDGGKFIDSDSILRHVDKMLQSGADIIDIGGESTRPGSNPVGVDEEIDRVCRNVELIKREFDTFISVDTYKSEVALESLKAGAEMINDISGFTFDDRMIGVIKPYDPYCVIMHIKGTPRDMQFNPQYNNVVDEVFDFLRERYDLLRGEGLTKLFVDPGFGFGKTVEHNYKLINNIDKFTDKFPVLIGVSRKSMIGSVTDCPVDKRLPGTIALNTLGLMNGVKIIRVHDVEEHVQVRKVVEKILNTK